MKPHGDFGLTCPKCGNEDTWDRLFGECWKCGLKIPKWSIWQRIEALLIRAGVWV